MFDEVNVCVLSAVYSSWPLSHGAPSDTYGGNLFKFFSRESSKRGENGLGILGLEISLIGWDHVRVYLFGGTGNEGIFEKRVMCFV